MNKYEILTILISLLAVTVSVISLVRTRKTEQKQQEHQEIINKLSLLQIKNIEEENKAKTKPIFQVTLSKDVKDYFFYIENTGEGSAYDVNFELVDCPENPLVQDYTKKFPCTEMKPNSSKKLLVGFNSDSSLTYKVRLSWKNISGELCSKMFIVTL